MKIGAQLFSVCDKCKTEEGIRETFKKMRDIGYESVQLSGFKYDPDKIVEYKNEFNMHVGLTHTDIPTLLNDVDTLIANHKKMGVEVIGLGYPGVYLSEDMRKEIDTIYQAIAALSVKESSGNTPRPKIGFKTQNDK